MRKETKALRLALAESKLAKKSFDDCGTVVVQDCGECLSKLVESSGVLYQAVHSAIATLALSGYGEPAGFYNTALFGAGFGLHSEDLGVQLEAEKRIRKVAKLALHDVQAFNRLATAEKLVGVAYDELSALYRSSLGTSAVTTRSEGRLDRLFESGFRLSKALQAAVHAADTISVVELDDAAEVDAASVSYLNFHLSSGEGFESAEAKDVLERLLAISHKFLERV
jgi:hypothetical protein